MSGGRFGSPEDFVVEELPAYLPAGEGGHTFVWVEKRERTSDEVARWLAREAGVSPGDVGYAGRKDRAAGLVVRDWIDNRVMPAFEGRVLPVDAAVVRRRAQLPYANTRDGLLAATALEHGLTFVTHRVSAFRAGRVKLLNPSGYIAQPSDEDEDWAHGAQSGQQWLKNLYVRA